MLFYVYYTYIYIYMSNYIFIFIYKTYSILLYLCNIKTTVINNNNDKPLCYHLEYYWIKYMNQPDSKECDQCAKSPGLKHLLKTLAFIV